MSRTDNYVVSRRGPDVDLTLAKLLMLGGSVDLLYEDWSGNTLDRARLVICVRLEDGGQIKSSIDLWSPPAGRDKAEMAAANCALSLGHAFAVALEHARRLEASRR